MRIVLFEPDIPQNAGTLIRLAACLGVACDIVEPCGFLFGDRHLRRAGLDYMEAADGAAVPIVVRRSCATGRPAASSF